MKGRRVEYDLAYGCFLVCGLAALAGSLMEAVPSSTALESSRYLQCGF